jgi:hypothetical protein
MRTAILWLLALGLMAAEPTDAAADIDRLIEADLAAQKLPPLPAADPATLARRAWIDLGGRLPSAAEAKAGQAAGQSALATQLVGSPAWQHATFSWLADLLRVQSRLQDRVPGQEWIVWLRAALQANTPWDEMAKAMLTATGPALAADSGATGFALRDAGMPLDHAALSSQTFLGTRIGCAQCHDHPFDRWTRLEFTRYAAFSADARTQVSPGKIPGLKQAMADAAPDLRQATRAISTLIAARVEPGRKDWLEAPKDWEGSDAKPGERITAQALFAPAAPAAAGDPRLRLATWMTSRDNPRFALAIGNRVWKRVFGLGLIEPVDDLRGDPSDPLPPLQARLARLVVDCNFDLQRIHLTLCLTRHWARGTWTGPLPERGGVVPGRPAARLSATVWWDSLVTLMIDDPDAAPVEDLSALHALRDRLQAGGTEAILEAAHRLISMRKGGPKVAAKDPEMLAIVRILRPTQRKMGKEPPRRASALPQPAPPNHPLRVLGQSDRELIDNASTEPATTQALLLMNGVIDSDILVPRSRLMRELAAQPNAPARISHLWMAVLNRPPTAVERERAMTALSTDPSGGLADVAWALLNGAEARMTR